MQVCDDVLMLEKFIAGKMVFDARPVSVKE
jgi:hypothetical protein